jgi:hypothetical protein
LLVSTAAALIEMQSATRQQVVFLADTALQHGDAMQLGPLLSCAKHASQVVTCMLMQCGSMHAQQSRRAVCLAHVHVQCKATAARQHQLLSSEHFLITRQGMQLVDDRSHDVHASC